MEAALDEPPMDLKASTECEVRKLQDMVKKLEKQNEILRLSQDGGQSAVAPPKRSSLDLEEVTLINLNDSPDELEDSWLYESPTKQATPAQKSVNSMKWAKSVSVQGLDEVRGSLIDKLDEIETQQDISRVRGIQTASSWSSMLSEPKNSLFFQPSKTVISQKRETSSPSSSQSKPEDLLAENNQLDNRAFGSMDEMDDMPTGPIMKRSAGAGRKDGPKTDAVQNGRISQSENVDNEPQDPILRRSALGKSCAGNDSSRLAQQDDWNGEASGTLQRSPLAKGSPKNELQKPTKLSQSNDLDNERQGPILRRAALSKDKMSSSQVNSSPESQSVVNNSSNGSCIQPRSRRIRLSDNDFGERGSLETSSQSSQDDVEDDINEKAPVVRRSALALPKPSSEGLCKQLWYSGPISQMNKQKTKSSTTAIRRSVSPSPDQRNRLQTRSPGAASGIAVRRSAGSRGSVEDILDVDDYAPVQRRSLTQVPTETVGVKSRAARSDEGITNKSRLKPRSKIQTLQQPQGSIATRRSMLTSPSTTPSRENKGVVSRRKAPPQTSGVDNLDDSWQDGCY